MKNKVLVLSLATMLAVLWPFSCTPQSPVIIGDGDGCDTIYVESPQLDKQFKEFEAMISRLTEENEVLTTSNNGVKQQLEACNEDVAQKEAIIATQTATITGQEATISEKNEAIAQKNEEISTKNTEIASLEAEIVELENRPPETVIDTVTVEADFITVGGIEYKVDDIELIKPLTEVVEFEMFFCYDTLDTGQQTTGKRPFLHEGSPSVYPHYVNVASKDRGLIKVWFETPLDSTIKVAKSWILDERRSYEDAKTRYVYKSHTKF